MVNSHARRFVAMSALASLLAPAAQVAAAMPA
jgi:hypothetical protein